MPLYSEGLWLAVMLMAPARLASRVAKLTTGVGQSRVVRWLVMPFPAITSARGGGKGLGPEAGIVADHHSLMGEAFLLQIVGNGLAHQAGVGEGEIFRQNTPPTRGSEFNFRHPGQFLLQIGYRVVQADFLPA